MGRDRSGWFEPGVQGYAERLRRYVELELVELPATRGALPLFEAEAGRIKVNPLATWSGAQILAYLDAHDLPRHDLVAKGYPSIGCIACTSAVKPGEDARAGRWRGRGKVECGLHAEPLTEAPLLR